ncbi:YbjN domain-containing protein [uncultured Sphingomonas sp.]|uniref:YbjN domain-containing protein n=1 Tax=uncultured Sphingomonas sp. TaxID=158754 RepID=UPI0025FBC8CE|nr:YbjN domain-containing protein [uncultured Sphingomonas sp.]
MIADEYEGEQDDEAPIDTLESYFDARGWTHERLGDEEIIATALGSWTQYELRGVWREADRVLQFLALPDIRVAADKRAEVYETIGLVNEQLWIGHFELWSSNGILLFRHAALLDGAGETPLTSAQAGTLIEAAVDECERFYPVFQFVLWGGKSPSEAIAAAMIETHGEA